MAIVRVPPNCTSVTFVTSGVKVPDGNNLVSGITAQEATDVASPYSIGPGGECVRFANPNTGAVDMIMPGSITNITIGGVAYPVVAGIISAVPAIPATAFMAGGRQRDATFELVQG